MLCSLRRLCTLICLMPYIWLPTAGLVHKKIGPDEGIAGHIEPRYSFVTMAVHGRTEYPYQRRQMVYQVFALASSLRRHTEYPLQVLTDVTALEDAPSFTRGLQKLGATIRDVRHIRIPSHLKESMMYNWQMAWLKLQVFNMTEFDALIWLDSDALVIGSLDMLFTLPGMWAQGDDYFCTGEPTGLCSGLLLLKPDRHLFWDMMHYAESLTDLPGGDQELILRYFQEVKNDPVKLLKRDTASFGRCVAEREKSGEMFGMPFFVHKPDALLSCVRALSLVKSNSSAAKFVMWKCRHRSLGALWHDAICESSLPDHDKAAATFCKDGSWVPAGSDGRRQPISLNELDAFLGQFGMD
mmetsp:Transcript_44536/g.105543  ORF Transcript_44536/g.105543 Transcript_44536/m.105543 type:complete len:354 (-) Transcript_44536:13-1074(-)